MPMWTKVLLIGLTVVTAAIVLALSVGTRRQQSALSTLVDRLIQPTNASRGTDPTLEEFDNLPAPVARYLQWALPEPIPQIRVARFSQVGTLRTDARSTRWMPFTACHLVVPQSEGFLWNARVRIAPWLHVQVIDSLITRRGSGHVRLLSALTIAADAGTPEMNSGSLHRYLAEAVWYPTALLPSAKLHWTRIDADKALATLSDNGVTVSLEFRFAGTGEVTAIYTPARWGSFDGGYKQLPWEGHFNNYEERAGMLVPTECEVGWHSNGDWEAVWKGQVTAVTYELTR
jgi:hypothetical protein